MAGLLMGSEHSLPKDDLAFWTLTVSVSTRRRDLLLSWKVRGMVGFRLS